MSASRTDKTEEAGEATLAVLSPDRATAESVLHAPPLQQLNQIAAENLPETGGPTLLRPLLRQLRRWLVPGLEQQLQAERAATAQVLNSVAQYLAHRETDVTRSIAEVADDVAHLELPATEKVGPRQASSSELEQAGKIEELRNRISELEALLLRSLPQGEDKTVPSVSSSEARYTLFENRFRGSEEQISERLKPYIELFVDSRLPVLELGSGRGELLSLLARAGVNAYGVDINQSMVDACVQKNLRAECEDLFTHLKNCEKRSLGGIIAVQVIEHLRLEELESLISLAAEVT